MLVALTVRKLKPGVTYEQFRSAFVPGDDMEVPPGWTRFHALRNVADESEVITYGYFEGTLEELRSGQSEGEYEARRAAAEELVESVGADGIYEMVEEREMG